MGDYNCSCGMDKVRHKNRKVFVEEIASVCDKLLFVRDVVTHPYSSAIYIQDDTTYIQGVKKCVTNFQIIFFLVKSVY